eukprot:CAMPEP_0178415110 /NCGR_PEP_ID=MMETSP0689_2-20121128/23383_1 /TAXON_ID=160604 /ORGANISM="Amphidinium massartii, Strain CS-259" /LENGTH=602 /DNA_ID=CAMNT_0020036421 /DNA_START=74 /DNA_END=1879 /DNA_ORIENTATION=+
MSTPASPGATQADRPFGRRSRRPRLGTIHRAQDEEAQQEDEDTSTSVNWGWDEITPLIGSRVYTSRQSCTVYTLVTCLPPLHSKKYGHWWTSHVCLALLLGALTVTLQLTLTVIAGGYIMKQTSYLTTRMVADLLHMETQAERFVVSSRHMILGEGVECCQGVDCTDKGLHCCPPQLHHRVIDSNTFEAPIGAEMDYPLMPDWSKRGGSLCYKKDGWLDCSPPSYRFLERWQELDVNQDDIWTYEEAKEDLGNLGCRLGLSTEEVFRSVCRSIMRQAEDAEREGSSVLPVPKMIKERLAVPKAYFEVWTGLVTLCGAVDTGHCGPMLMRGVFDGLLNSSSVDGHHWAGVTNLATALEYCNRLLRDGGICEQSLPPTFVVYKSTAEQACGNPSFAAGRYVNPYDPEDAQVIMGESFAQVHVYHQAQTLAYKVFVFSILYLWYTILNREIRAIVRLGEFCWFMPGNSEDPLKIAMVASGLSESFMRGQLTSSPTLRALVTGESMDSFGSLATKKVTVDSIPDTHRALCIAVFVVRIFLVLFLGFVGTAYSLNTFNFTYEQLLMDAVALAFIFELPEMVFTFLISAREKKELSQVDLRYKSLPVW